MTPEDIAALRQALAAKIVDICGGPDDSIPHVSNVLDHLIDALDAATKDAARYRFLNQDFSAMSANIDGDHSWAYRRNFSLRGPTLDAAIDAAMKGHA